jgi:hypothetical protein
VNERRVSGTRQSPSGNRTDMAFIFFLTPLIELAANVVSIAGKVMKKLIHLPFGRRR